MICASRSGCCAMYSLSGEAPDLSTGSSAVTNVQVVFHAGSGVERPRRRRRRRCSSRGDLPGRRGGSGAPQRRQPPQRHTVAKMAERWQDTDCPRQNNAPATRSVGHRRRGEGGLCRPGTPLVRVLRRWRRQSWNTWGGRCRRGSSAPPSPESRTSASTTSATPRRDRCSAGVPLSVVAARLGCTEGNILRTHRHDIPGSDSGPAALMDRMFDDGSDSEPTPHSPS